MEPFISRDKFEREVQVIEQDACRRLEAYLKVIRFCHQVLENYQAIVNKNGFTDLAAEIRFFKHQKQIPQETLIYYSLLKAYELEVPSEEALKQEYIKSRMLSLHSSFSVNQEFIQYLEMNADYLDEIYFTRKFSDVHWWPGNMYYRDPSFSTSRDLLLSEITANKKFLVFLQKEINGQPTAPASGKKLQWTSSKVDLTELVYALYHSGVINNGNATLKTVVEEVGSFMGVDLGDYHHTFLRLRERAQPLKFLEKIKDKLSERMQELDQ